MLSKQQNRLNLLIASAYLILLMTHMKLDIKSIPQVVFFLILENLLLYLCILAIQILDLLR